jgi:hypothetical protein
MAMVYGQCAEDAQDMMDIRNGSHQGASIAAPNAPGRWTLDRLVCWPFSFLVFLLSTTGLSGEYRTFLSKSCESRFACVSVESPSS